MYTPSTRQKKYTAIHLTNISNLNDCKPRNPSNIPISPSHPVSAFPMAVVPTRPKPSRMLYAQARLCTSKTLPQFAPRYTRATWLLSPPLSSLSPAPCSFSFFLEQKKFTIPGSLYGEGGKRVTQRWCYTPVCVRCWERRVDSVRMSCIARGC